MQRKHIKKSIKNLKERRCRNMKDKLAEVVNKTENKEEIVTEKMYSCESSGATNLSSLEVDDTR